MDVHDIIQQLDHNRNVLRYLLEHVPHEVREWKPAGDCWSLLEILCHLVDEEREDFRLRIKMVLDDPRQELPKFDPHVWVSKRNYADQNYDDTLKKFLLERTFSIRWLRQLDRPKWDNAYQHPKYGAMSAHLFLNNWLAHDYLHIRQINKNKYLFLKSHANTSLDYAGDW